MGAGVSALQRSDEAESVFQVPLLEDVPLVANCGLPPQGPACTVSAKSLAEAQLHFLILAVTPCSSRQMEKPNLMTPTHGQQ